MRFGARRTGLARSMIRQIRAMRVPVVAAIHGYAYGAAFDLILACDFRVAAESAFVGDIRVSRAINSMSGAAYWLPRYVGVGRAAEILLLGEKISARDALAWGLLTRVFPDADFESGLSEFTGRLATMPTGPLSILTPRYCDRRGVCYEKNFRGDNGAGLNH